VKSKRKAKPSETVKKEVAITLIVIVIAIVLVFALYSFLRAKPASNVLATVNGVNITQEDLNEIALTIPLEIRQNITNDVLLEQAINFEVIRQEAEKLGISVTDEEVEKSINDSLAKTGLTRADLSATLAQQKVEFSMMFNAYKKQLLSYKYINATILKNVTVSEQEIKSIYNQYSSQINASYDEVKEEINMSILSMKAQNVLSAILQEKRNESIIMRH